MDMTHCDRWETHVLLGKAPTQGNVPVAQIVDIDLVEEGFQTPRMAAWFGQLVYNSCLSPDNGNLKILLLDKGCKNPTESQGHDTASLEASVRALETTYHADPHFLPGLAMSLGTMGNAVSSFGEVDGNCLGIAYLVSRVVIPALNVALGKESAPDNWWGD
jgi:hypothetical protein